MSDNSAVRQRILGHMNKDHKLSLFDYLEHFKGIKLNRSKDDVRMSEISLDTMILTYKKNGGQLAETSIPIVPALSSYDDARHTLVLLAKEAAAGLGYSAYQVTRFVPIRPILFDLAPTTGIPTFALLTFFPDLVLPHIANLSPAIAHFLGNHASKALIGIAAVHLFEIITSMRPRLNKYRVPYPTRLYWIIANFFEGYPALYRFDEEVNRINH